MAERMHIIRVEHNSPLYRQAVALRSSVLREPLGLHYTEEQLQAEKGETHLAGMQNDAVIGCITLAPQDKGWMKLRQMAVAPEMQGKGIGRRLLAEAERMSKERGSTQLLLHARGTAIGFYEKAGYEKTGEPFLEQTIVHVKMWKPL